MTVLLPWAQLIVTLVVAIVAAWIAYQQWRIATVKVRLDLYDRRMSVFKQLRDFFADILANGNVSEKSLALFLNATAEVEFLFDRTLATNLTIIWNDAVALQALSKRLNGIGVGERRSEMAEREAEYFQKMLEHSRRLHNLFLPFLHVDPRNALSADTPPLANRWIDDLLGRRKTTSTT